MLETTFTEEQKSSEEDESGQSQQADYSFEGFSIEFSEKIMLLPVASGGRQLAKGQTTSHGFSLDPDRPGSFIIPDIYPGDLHGNPPFDVLPGLTVNGKEVVGCVIKASEGLGWGHANEEWFKRGWKKIREVAGDRYGVDFFRGCYHFLRFSADGARQADYFCDLIDAAGGWGNGDLMPWVDIEEGGQGSWAPEKLEKITDPTLRKRLADDITACATAFIRRFKERTGLRIAVYGRGVFRDLHMTNCKFGSDSAVNPAYTARIPSMENYGVPLGDISFWQLQGTPERGKPGSNGAQVRGYPRELGAWGQVDYSVYIDGPRGTTLKTFRERCLARP